MIELLLYFLRKRKAIATLPSTYGVSELLKIGSRVADYLVEVKEETQDTVEFSGNVSDWVVGYIPVDHLATKGSVSEYSVKMAMIENLKFGKLVWTYMISVVRSEQLNITCYIKPYKS